MKRADPALALREGTAPEPQAEPESGLPAEDAAGTAVSAQGFQAEPAAPPPVVTQVIVTRESLRPRCLPPPHQQPQARP